MIAGQVLFIKESSTNMKLVVSIRQLSSAMPPSAIKSLRFVYGSNSSIEHDENNESGQLNCGGVSSLTVMICVQAEVLPQRSVI